MQTTIMLTRIKAKMSPNKL